MFPLGSVLFPHVPLSLHVFEPRYRALVEDCLAATERRERAEFGVVLIERGHEVGGGDQRFTIGAVARITDVGRTSDGRYAVTAVGTQRLLVREWLPDAPYPLAEVDLVDEPSLDAGRDGGLMEEAETLVRRCLDLTAELGESTWPATVELDADPTARAWQLAGVAPLGPLDQLALLGSASITDLLGNLARMADEQASVLAFRLGSG
jgi:Lon protease-like protein